MDKYRACARKRKHTELSTRLWLTKGLASYLSLYTDLSKICMGFLACKSFSGKGSSCTFRRLIKENVWNV
jgi:hypothetical protein